MRLPLALAIASLLAACGERDTNGEARAGGDTAPAATADQPVALGLTRDQLEDAEILDAQGREIADVERVVTDAGGTATGLLVEVEDSDPDRYVTIPIEGLQPTSQGGDPDLRSSLTREQLMAMPETPR